MKKYFLSFILSISLVFNGVGQDQAGVKACIENYLDGITKGDAAKLNLAFHQAAMLRTVNPNGDMAEFPVKTFIAKTPAGGVPAKPKIVSYSVIGQSAVATVELAFADFKYVDYLSLLKLGNEWKIVCRVFSKADLTQESTTIGTSTNSSSSKKTTPKAKPKSDDGW